MPDRKPCLKVTLFLPATAAGAAATNATPNTSAKSPAASADTNPSGMKKATQISRDFTAVTLNPKWNSSFLLPLPFSKSVLRAAVERQQIAATGPLSDRDYEVVVKALLQHWSGGMVELEVFDGERFNEEIFMGRVQLLLTSFHLSIKKFDELEMKGSYQLDKAKAGQRVSGSVQLHAFLHVPEKKFVEEQLAQCAASLQLADQQKKLGLRPMGPASRSLYGNFSAGHGREAFEGSSNSEGEGEGESSSSELPRHGHGQSRGGQQRSGGKVAMPNRRLTQVPGADSKAVASRSVTPRTASEDNLLAGARAGSAQKKRTPQQQPAPQISSFVKSLASREISSQDESDGLLFHDSGPEDLLDTAPPANLRTPLAFATPQPPAHSAGIFLHQQHPSGGSSASSARLPPASHSGSHGRTPHSADSAESGLLLQTPPISSLDELRGQSSEAVSSIVSKETARESLLSKKLFLADMSRQLSGLEALAHSAEASVDSFTKKLLSPDALRQLPKPLTPNPAARQLSLDHTPSASADRRPSPGISRSHSGGAGSGGGNVSRGLQSLKDRVNLAVSNLGPLLDPEDDGREESFEQSQADFRRAQAHAQGQQQSPSKPLGSYAGIRKSYSNDFFDEAEDEHGYEMDDDDDHDHYLDSQAEEEEADDGDESSSREDGDDEEGESGRNYFEKRVSVRDLQDQQIYKFHFPDSDKAQPGHALGQGQGQGQGLGRRPLPPLPPQAAQAPAPAPAAPPTSKSFNRSRSHDEPQQSQDQPPALAQPVPTRPSPNKSTAAMFESRSLSREDIEELSQRVRQLSRLSQSSADDDLALSSPSLSAKSSPEKTAAQAQRMRQEDGHAAAEQNKKQTAAPSASSSRVPPPPPPPPRSSTPPKTAASQPTGTPNGRKGAGLLTSASSPGLASPKSPLRAGPSNIPKLFRSPRAKGSSATPIKQPPQAQAHALAQASGKKSSRDAHDP